MSVFQHTRQHCPWWERGSGQVTLKSSKYRPLGLSPVRELLSVSSSPFASITHSSPRRWGGVPYKQDSNYPSVFCSQESCMGSKGWGLLVPQACSPWRSWAQEHTVPLWQELSSTLHRVLHSPAANKRRPFHFQRKTEERVRW